MLNNLIDWSKVTLQRMSDYSDIFEKYQKEIEKACPLLEQEEMIGILKDKTGEDWSNATPMEIAANFRDVSYSSAHIYEHIPELVEEVLKFWTGKKSVLQISTDKDVLLGLYHKLEQIEIPDKKPLKQFDFNNVRYYVTKERKSLKKDIELGDMDIWQLVNSLGMAGKTNQWKELAYNIGIFYWENGVEPSDKELYERMEYFMGLDVVTAKRCAFFLNQRLVTLSTYSGRILMESVTS